MFLEKYGNYKGYYERNYSYLEAVNRLQDLVHFFLDVLDSERLLELAKCYSKMSKADKEKFDYEMERIDSWISIMAEGANLVLKETEAKNDGKTEQG